MTMIVKVNLSATGPRGVPNGCVDAKNSGQGISPCRAISRMIRAWPIVCISG